MKKVVLMMILAACICTMLAVSAGAAADPMAVKFQDALGLLDCFYDYGPEYMISVASDYYVNWDNMGPVVVSAEEYEKVLRDHFVIDDATLQSIRNYGSGAQYDGESQTYTLEWNGGFGGSMQPRDYLGYVKNGDTYDVYYHTIRYSFLCDVLPEGVDENTYVEENMNPDTWRVEYEGVVYESGPDGFFAILGHEDSGRKYTVEMNGDIVRIISCTDYTAGQAPERFDDQVIYEIPEDSGITIPDNNCFAGSTTVKVEKVTDSSTMQTVSKAMEKVAEKYVAYEFTAVKDNATVQPDGKLEVTFAIPSGYSDNVSVYYVAENGTLEKLATTVNAAARTVTAQLEHFSTYVLADEETKPHQHDYKAVVTKPTCTQEGYTTYSCACGDSYTADTVPKKEHSYGQWQQTKAPTATEEGEETRKCANCDQVETRSVDALGQEETTVPPTSEPTTPPASEPTDPPTSEPTQPSTEVTQPSTEVTQPSAGPAPTEPDNKEGSGSAGNVIAAVIAVAAVALLGGSIVLLYVLRKKK